jgi:hypothetical protein
MSLGQDITTSFKNNVMERIFKKMKIIRKKGINSKKSTDKIYDKNRFIMK